MILVLTIEPIDDKSGFFVCQESPTKYELHLYELKQDQKIATESILELKETIDYILYIAEVNILLFSSNNGVMQYDLEKQSLSSILETKFDYKEKNQPFKTPRMEESEYHFPFNPMKDTPSLKSIAKPQFKLDLNILAIQSADKKLEILKFDPKSRKFKQTCLRVYTQYNIAQFKFLPHDAQSLLVLCQNSSFLLYKMGSELTKISIEEFFTIDKVLMAGQSYEQFWVSKYHPIVGQTIKLVVLCKSYVKKDFELIHVNFNINSEEFVICGTLQTNGIDNIGLVIEFFALSQESFDLFISEDEPGELKLYHYKDGEENMKVQDIKFGENFGVGVQFVPQFGIFLSIENNGHQISTFKAPQSFIESLNRDRAKPNPQKYLSPEKNGSTKNVESQIIHSVNSTYFRTPTKQTYSINPQYFKDSLVGNIVPGSNPQKMRGSLQFSFSGKKAYGNGFSASRVITRESVIKEVPEKNYNVENVPTEISNFIYSDSHG